MLAFGQTKGRGPWVPYHAPEALDGDGSVIPWLGGEGLERSLEPDLSERSEEEARWYLEKQFGNRVGRYEPCDGDEIPVLLFLRPETVTVTPPLQASFPGDPMPHLPPGSGCCTRAFAILFAIVGGVGFGLFKLVQAVVASLS